MQNLIYIIFFRNNNGYQNNINLILNWAFEIFNNNSKYNNKLTGDWELTIGAVIKCM